MDTWDYLATDQDYTAETIPDDYVWERLRLRRDSMLAATDFRMVSDAPWDLQPWVTYRQALRNLPAATTNPRTAVWPVAP